MNNGPDSELINEFLDAFEEVFDRDWGYTKSMLGIHNATEEQKKEQAKLEAVLGEKFTESGVAEAGTFLNPQVLDEVEDWGNRGCLLNAYRALKRTRP